ncbi:hypothetical protein [Rhodanobacter terrae]|uniref:Uncharacterized protein n=1 Tax=Rhodanobacter terrae TaxID=418647 RepID=A0ABW0SYS3_9GAMM
MFPLAAIGGQRFQVSARSIHEINGSLYLKLTVRNCSDVRSVTQLADMPWGEHAIGLVVYAAGSREGEALRQVTKIADFPDKNIVLQSGSLVSGEINLTNIFPDLLRYKNYKDLVLFWVYDMSLLEGGRSNYVGGMLPFTSTGNDKEVICSR